MRDNCEIESDEEQQYSKRINKKSNRAIMDNDS